MTKHLRMMSGMIRDLKTTGNVLTDEQQVKVVIRSLPDSWISMKQIMTHNENIKNFADISRHVELEAAPRGDQICSPYRPWWATQTKWV
jgi:ABC-type taurine transport system substrate-binding protein